MKSTYKEAMQKMAETITQLPWEDREFYANYLAQTYYFVSHSTRLLALGASRFNVAQREFHNRFLEHAKEEKNHEVSAQSDLRTLGKRLEDFPESAYTRALYATQYYNIEHIRPEMFFGYIVVLEGVAVEVFPKVYPTLEATYGKSACRFLKLHVDEDPDHIDKAFVQMERLDPALQQQISQEIQVSAEQYLAILRHAAQTTSLIQPKLRQQTPTLLVQ